MEQCTEVAGKLPETAETMKAAEQVLQVTKLAWLGTAKREATAVKVNRPKVEFKRPPIHRSYLKLLALEI